MSKRRQRKPRARAGRLRRWGAVVVWANALLLAAMIGWFLVQPAPRRVEVASLLSNYAEGGKRITLLDVALDLYELYYAPGMVPATTTGDRRHVYGGFPEAAGLGASVRVLANRGYMAGYAEALESPVWAAYRVVDVDELPASPPRPDRFEVDRRTVARVRSEEYTGSGYDRGHLAPNYAIATRYGEVAQRETFLMSNIVPQRHALNAGLWKSLEQKIAISYPGRFGEVWAVVGPIFSTTPRRLPDGVTVPEAFYMIVVDENDRGVRAQALILPQELPEGAKLADYRVSIDDVEQRTGLDFFPEMPLDAQATLEAGVVRRVW